MGHSSSSSSGFRSHSIFLACVRSLPFLHSTFFTFFFFFFFTFVVVVSSSSSLSILSSYLGHNNLWFWKDKNKFEKKNSVTSRVFFFRKLLPFPLSRLLLHEDSLSLSLSSKGYTFLCSCFCEQKLLSPRTKTNRSDSLLSSFLFAFFVCRVC